jgi:hypothetical protein
LKAIVPVLVVATLPFWVLAEALMATWAFFKFAVATCRKISSAWGDWVAVGVGLGLVPVAGAVGLQAASARLPTSTSPLMTRYVRQDVRFMLIIASFVFLLQCVVASRLKAGPASHTHVHRAEFTVCQHLLY